MGQRDDLLAGARACLAEKGYSHTTARDIVAASGTHLASIGYHFGSKDNLMNTAVLEATSEWGDTIEAAARAAGAGSPAETLRALLDELFSAIPRERDLLVASVQAYAQAQFAGEVRGPLAEAAEHGRAELAATIMGGRAEDVDADTAKGLGSLAYALIAGFVLQSLLDPGSLPTADQVLKAVRALGRPAPAGPELD